jgi:hypothetical protein
MAKSLMAVLGIGKGTWGHVARLISEENWDKIIIVSNEWGKENFSPAKECDWIIVNNRAPFGAIVEEIKKNIPEGEIAVNLASGNGKEHMALIASLLDTHKPFQIVTLTNDGIKYF